jgi:flavorubredoxin
MARAIADGIGEGGASAVLMPLGSNHRSDVATQILESGALLVGSPTINSGMFPRVADVLSYLRGLKPRNLVGAAFGSYGWSGEAVGQIEGILKEMKVDLVVDSIKAKYVPDDDILTRCRELGKVVGGKLVEICRQRAG